MLGIISQLSLLHIDPAKPFRFEMAAITQQRPEGKSQFITLGGSLNAFMWNKRFWTARIQIADKQTTTGAPLMRKLLLLFCGMLLLQANILSQIGK